MAKEKVIEIKTGPAIKNIQDLKDNIKAYKEQLATLEIGTKEYQSTLVSLQENQAALRNAMYGTAASMKDVMDAATAANVTFDDQNRLVKAETLSYNELVRELAILKEEWRSTTDETERAALGEKINNVNNQLKGMDATVGVFGRNVGNYVGSLQQFASGLGGAGKGLTAMLGPIKAADGALKAFSVNPVIAILGVLAMLIQEVTKAMKSSEDNTQAMTAAMAPLAAVGDVLKTVLQAVAKVVIGLIDGFGKLTRAIFGTNSATEKRIQLAEMEKELAQTQRDNLVKNAQAERDIAELRAKASERDKYSATQRLNMLEEAGRREAEIAERARKEAHDQYEAMKLKASLSKSTKEEIDALAQAEANMIKADTAYYQAIRTINTGIQKARRDEARDARAAAKEREDARKAELAAYRDLLKQEIALLEEGSTVRLQKQKELLTKEYEAAVKDAKDKIKNSKTLNRTLLALRKKYQTDVEQAERAHRDAILHIQLQGLENSANEYAKGTKENLRKLMLLRRAELKTMYRKEGESAADYRARELAAQWAYAEAIRALNTKITEEATETLTLAYQQSAQTTEQTLAYEQAMAEARVNQIRTLGREAGETETAYLTRIAEAEKAAADASQAILDYQDQQQILAAQNRMDALQENSLAYLDAAVALKKTELDLLHKTEEESDEEFRARQLEAEKAYDDALKARVAGRVSLLQSYAGAVSGILGGLADMYESGTDVSEEEARKAKNLRIAGAVIDMFSGAVGAYTQAAKSIAPPAGPIIGAVNAATVVATSLANIAKMKAQAVDATSSATVTGASVPAPSVTPSVEEVRTVTSASEEDRLNRMADDQRVYILDSDLQAAANSRAVKVAETTF